MCLIKEFFCNYLQHFVVVSFVEARAIQSPFLLFLLWHLTFVIQSLALEFLFTCMINVRKLVALNRPSPLQLWKRISSDKSFGFFFSFIFVPVEQHFWKLFSLYNSLKWNSIRIFGEYIFDIFIYFIYLCEIFYINFVIVWLVFWLVRATDENLPFHVNRLRFN